MTRRARNKYEQRERTSPLKQTKTIRYVQKKKKNDSPLDLERQLVEVGYRNSASPHKQWNTRNFVSFLSHEISSRNNSFGQCRAARAHDGILRSTQRRKNKNAKKGKHPTNSAILKPAIVGALRTDQKRYHSCTDRDS